MKALNSWMIFAILVGVAIVCRLFFDLLGDWLGFSSGIRVVGTGICVGFAASLLTARLRTTSINVQENR